MIRWAVSAIKYLSSYNPDYMDWLDEETESAEASTRKNWMEVEILRAKRQEQRHVR